MSHHLHSLAFISAHSSPLAQPGTTKAGGMNVYIAELTRQLGRLGRTVDIFTRRDHPDLPESVELSPNVRVVHIPAGPPRRLAPLQVRPILPEFTDRVRAWARDHGRRYDLIHSHYWLSALTGLALADEWRCPHVVMFHTLGEVKNRAPRAEREPSVRIEAERTIVRRADRLICATPHERDFLVQLYGAHPECVSVVPGGVDLEHFRPGDRAAARRGLGLPNGPLALFVGRLLPLKGVDILIRAAAAADLAQPLHVLVVGGDGQDGPLRDSLRKLSAELGIAPRVQFRDAVNRRQLPRYYQAADVCVVPSFYESFGLVAVEALATGTPVIATRVGGLQHTVRDGQTGYLISWRCPEPFAERIETLLESADLRARFGRAARDSALPYAWATVAGRIAGVYEELLQRHAAGVGAGCHAS